MSSSLCPRAAAASPLLNCANKSPCVATRIVARRSLPGKLFASNCRQRRKPDLLDLFDLIVAASAAPQHSPQNTEDPLVGPSPSLSATEAVEVQLRALEADDTPWPGHGVQTAYLFCRDSGSMDMSRYFCGRSASLYHEDHFVGKFRTTFPELLKPGARISKVLEGGDESGSEPVKVEVETAATMTRSDNDEPSPSSTLIFSLERCEMGRRKGSWLVAAVHRKGEEE